MTFFKALVLALLIGQPLRAQNTLEDSAKVRTCPEPSEKITQLLKKMSLEEKVGQLLLIGFSGDRLSHDITSKLKKIKPGGIIFFRHNIKSAYQVAQLNQKILEESKKNQTAPPFLAIDQEGGSVTRISLNPPMPSAEVMGIINDVGRSQLLGQKIGQILKQLGFNMNLAPVIEAAKPGRATFLRSRVFSEDTSTVTKLGGSFASGLMQSKIIPTYKHFPGHGITKKDPHKTAPSLLDSKESLIENRVQSFHSLISKNLVPSLMLAHVKLPNIEPRFPLATYSPTLINDILREELGYCGLVITDDIEMEGAKNLYSSAERAKRSLIAGSDLVMVAWNSKAQNETYSALLQAFKSGQINMDHLNRRVARILSLKESFGILNSRFSADLNAIKRSMEDSEYKSLASSIYKDARLTVGKKLRKDLSRKPAKNDHRKNIKNGRTRRN